LNEFAQAIDHLRLKLSFEDIVKLYRFIDKEGKVASRHQGRVPPEVWDDIAGLL